MKKLLPAAWLIACLIGPGHAAAPGEATAKAKAESHGHVLAEFGGSDLPPLGATITRDEMVEFKDNKVTINSAGTVQSGTMRRQEHRIRSLTALTATKFRRLHQNTTVEGEMTIAGQAQKMSKKPDPLEGVPVIVERNNGTFTARLEAGEPTPPQVEGLAKLVAEFKNDTDLTLYGNVPRQPGDKWNVDPKQLHSYAGMENHSGTMALEFVKIAEFQGVRCAVLKASFDLSGTPKGEPGKKLTLKGSTMTYRSLADRINLESTIEAAMVMEGDVRPEVSMKVEGSFVGVQKATLAKP